MPPCASWLTLRSESAREAPEIFLMTCLGLVFHIELRKWSNSEFGFAFSVQVLLLQIIIHDLTRCHFCCRSISHDTPLTKELILYIFKWDNGLIFTRFMDLNSDLNTLYNGEMVHWKLMYAPAERELPDIVDSLIIRCWLPVFKIWGSGNQESKVWVVPLPIVRLTCKMFTSLCYDFELCWLKFLISQWMATSTYDTTVVSPN